MKERLAANVARETGKRMILPSGQIESRDAAGEGTMVGWPGRCEVHEKFTVADVQAYRDQFPGVQVIAHPECRLDVLEAADLVGSTAGMIKYLSDQRPERVVMITECSMSDNVSVDFPEIDFVRSCTLCPHMKKITLESIVAALKHRQFEIEVAPEVAERALRAVERMLEVGRGERG